MFTTLTYRPYPNCFYVPSIPGVNNYCDRYTDMIYRVACDSGPMINLAQDPRMRTVVEQLEDLCPLDKLQEKRQWRDKAIASLAKIRRDLDNSEKDMKA